MFGLWKSRKMKEKEEVEEEELGEAEENESKACCARERNGRDGG